MELLHDTTLQIGMSKIYIILHITTQEYVLSLYATKTVQIYRQDISFQCNFLIVTKYQVTSEILQGVKQL